MLQSLKRKRNPSSSSCFNVLHGYTSYAYTHINMKKNIFVSPLTDTLAQDREIEIVERKGLGHPDTICDLIAEDTSIALCKYYIEEFGSIMHHNVDKALLVGGISEPLYGGGKIVKPIEITIAGRAIKEKKGKNLPVDEIARDAARESISKNIRHLDAEDHVRIDVKIRPGSKDLIDLFERFGKGDIPLSNDTSMGTGYYPLDTLEETVLKTEKLLNNSLTKRTYPYIGEDIKVMGIRYKEKITLTVAIAIVDRYVSSINDYIQKINEVKEFLEARNWIGEGTELRINTADDYADESVYLTVTGTSAEGGDDGQVGRGNRASGLITPYRPMSLEAVAGKNPVSHVGKIYNLFANELCRLIVQKGYAEEAYCYIVSQIGKPINEPIALDIQLKGKDYDEKATSLLTEKMLDEMPLMWAKVLEGQFRIV